MPRNFPCILISYGSSSKRNRNNHHYKKRDACLGQTAPASFYLDYSSFNISEVQNRQRVASTEISLLQNGHILTAGAAKGVSSSFFFPRPAALFTTFIKQNKINAIMKKFTTDDKNADTNPARKFPNRMPLPNIYIYLLHPQKIFNIIFIDISLGAINNLYPVVDTHHPVGSCLGFPLIV